MLIQLSYVRKQKESTYAKEIIMLGNYVTIMIMIIMTMLITIMFITKVAILLLNEINNDNHLTMFMQHL